MQGDERGYAQERQERARDVLAHGESGRVGVTFGESKKVSRLLEFFCRRLFIVLAAAAPLSPHRPRARVPPQLIDARDRRADMGQQKQTGKTRTKRAAIPNSPAARKTIKKAAADKKEATIVRSYAEKKRLKQERAAKFENVKHKNNTNFGSEGMKLKSETKGPMEVRFRALAKKLRQIAELEAKKKEGAKLDQWQLAKLRKKPFVKAEIRALKKAVGGDEAGEEDESEDSGSEDEDDDDEE